MAKYRIPAQVYKVIFHSNKNYISRVHLAFVIIREICRLTLKQYTTFSEINLCYIRPGYQTLILFQKTLFITEYIL